MVQHPLILDVAAKLLDRARAFQLHLTQTIAIGPGETAQAHQRTESVAIGNLDVAFDAMRRFLTEG